MTDPNPMVEIPQLELQGLRDELEDLRSRAISQDELDYLRTLPARVETAERLAGERNTLATRLDEMTQERDRLRALLLGIVPSMQSFGFEYPQASIARTAFAGSTPEEIADKMFQWDDARGQRAAEWAALINNIRTQATV